MLAFITTAILCASGGRECVATDRVGLIELNHFYDEQGRIVFDQVIFYDWSAHRERFNVVAWRLFKPEGWRPISDRDRKDWVKAHPAQKAPPKMIWAGGRMSATRDRNRGDYVMIWHDKGDLRLVRSKLYRETWTQSDPELAERNHLPMQFRRELARLTAVKRGQRYRAPPGPD